MTVRTICWAAGLALATAACGADDGARAAEPPSDADIRSAMEDANVPGLAVAYLRACEIGEVRTFGVADVETGAPVTQRTAFEAASLSKPVFAYLFMQAVDDGVVGLDDRIAAHLDTRRILFDAMYARITPRQALSHQAGFPNWVGNPGDPDRGDLLSFLFEPGAMWSYSGEGYQLAQAYFEMRAGTGIEAAREASLGDAMPSSSFEGGPPADLEPAYGHDSDGGKAGGRPLTAREAANAAHSLVTTVGDYAAFTARACAGVGLSDAAHAEMLAPQVQLEGTEWGGDPADLGAATLSWTVGWGLHELEGRRVSFHWGDNGAFKAFAAFDPASGDGVVYFANAAGGLDLIRPLGEPVLGDLSAISAWLD